MSNGDQYKKEQDRLFQMLEDRTRVRSAAIYQRRLKDFIDQTKLPRNVVLRYRKRLIKHLGW